MACIYNIQQKYIDNYSYHPIENPKLSFSYNCLKMMWVRLSSSCSILRPHPLHWEMFTAQCHNDPNLWISIGYSLYIIQCVYTSTLCSGLLVHNYAQIHDLHVAIDIHMFTTFHLHSRYIYIHHILYSSSLRVFIYVHALYRCVSITLIYRARSMTDTVDAVESFPDLLFLGIGCDSSKTWHLGRGGVGCIHSTSGLFSSERFIS